MDLLDPGAVAWGSLGIFRRAESPDIPGDMGSTDSEAEDKITMAPRGTERKIKQKKRIPRGNKGVAHTLMEQTFIEEYLNCWNASEAARRAGYSPGFAKQAGYRLLHTPDIRKEIENIINKMQNTPGVATPEEVMLGYTRDLRFDPRKLYDDTGTPLPPNELDDDTALSLAGIEVTEKIVETATKDGSNTTSYRNSKYKLPDKRATRDSLAKIHGLFVDRQEISGKNGEPLAIIIGKPDKS